MSPRMMGSLASSRSFRLSHSTTAASGTGLAEIVSAGEFEVTSTPDWPLCNDCPARRRLCSGPAAAPEEAQPEASPA